MDTCPAELYGDVRDNQEQQEGLSQASRTQDSYRSRSAAREVVGGTTLVSVDGN